MDFTQVSFPLRIDGIQIEASKRRPASLPRSKDYRPTRLSHRITPQKGIKAQTASAFVDIEYYQFTQFLPRTKDAHSFEQTSRLRDLPMTSRNLLRNL